MIASAIRRQLPLDEEEDDRDRDDDQDVLEEEDQAVAEEEADALEVDRRARHQLAGLVAVVEAEREPHEARVERGAHVHLDAERLPAGDEAAADHQPCLDHAEPEDRPDVDPEQLRVLRHDRLVDHAADDPDERDLRRLRAAGEDDRDDERGLVRLAGSRAAGKTSGDMEPAPLTVQV